MQIDHNTQGVDRSKISVMLMKLFDHWGLTSAQMLGLLGIHKSLRLLFPHNRQLAYDWMTQANRAFGGLSPVSVAEKYGIMGLHQVRSYLDVQRGR